uniref:Uncharacterized protein n=1 Tax=Ornithodoros erraticus TaxID=265619 RepID=A0A293LD75_ORNER
MSCRSTVPQSFRSTIIAFGHHTDGFVSFDSSVVCGYTNSFVSPLASYSEPGNHQQPSIDVLSISTNHPFPSRFEFQNSMVRFQEE